jgi:hypothetical protein
MNTEQRACARLSVVKNAYAALKLGTYKVGKIKNISMKGLMFTYIGRFIPADTIAELDLFIPQEGFYTPSLPCKVVCSVTRKGKNKSLSFAPLRCGLSIGLLNEQQKKSLEDFINRST